MSYNLSASPHVRSSVTTRSVMWDVIIALLPATAFGVYRFGWHALLIILTAIASAIVSEYVYQKITHKPILIGDGSAVLTGLLLGLNMPSSVPIWIPILGSVFAIIFVKQIFGGLGKNFMNPALGGRCFLLISFTGIMSTFEVDGVTSATPLAMLKNGEKVRLFDMFLGNTAGVIGEVSVVAILLGGIYLLCKRIISWEIPVCYIGTFALFIFLFGGFDPAFTLIHVCGGGLMLGAWFMATDYVTSPISSKGKIVYGILLGVLTGIFRLYGVSAEGVSYAIIFCNLLVPLIEKITMPKAFGLEKVKKEKADKKAPAADAATAEGEAAAKTEPEVKAPISLKAYHAALNLTIIALVVGVLLGVVYQLTKQPIADAVEAEAQAAYKVVCPQAAKFVNADAMTEKAAAELANGAIADGKFGKVKVESALKSVDANGTGNGFVVNVTSSDGFGGNKITVSVGTDANGKITGIAFLTINETAGLGMNATNEAFYSQYLGKDVKEFSVTKTGSTQSSEIDAISSATITSKAVTNAVNTALYVISNFAE